MHVSREHTALGLTRPLCLSPLASLLSPFATMSEIDRLSDSELVMQYEHAKQHHAAFNLREQTKHRNALPAVEDRLRIMAAELRRRSTPESRAAARQQASLQQSNVIAFPRERLRKEHEPQIRIVVEMLGMRMEAQNLNPITTQFIRIGAMRLEHGPGDLTLRIAQEAAAIRNRCKAAFIQAACYPTPGPFS
jgi:hypothetical protein